MSSSHSPACTCRVVFEDHAFRVTWTVTKDGYSETHTLPEAFSRAGRAVEKGMAAARRRAAELEQDDHPMSPTPPRD